MDVWGIYLKTIEPLFWLKLLVLLTIAILLFLSFHEIMSRLLKVEKKKLFSYEHINKRHKSIDWTIRITFLVVIVIGYVINTVRDPLDSIWFINTWFLFFVFLIVSELVRAVMEWKYAEDANAYIFTLSQLGFIIIVLLSVFMMDFFGLF